MRLSEFYKIYNELFVIEQTVEKICSYVRDMAMGTVRLKLTVKNAMMIPREEQKIFRWVCEFFVTSQ
jgi:hypothetical protein